MKIVSGLENATFTGEQTNAKRDSKGRSLVDLPESYCVIDIETTGLDPRYDEIIEIAAIKVKNGLVQDSMVALVKPNNEVDEYITELTGITNEMLSDAESIETVLPIFTQFWGDSILIGHNVNFDINFLYDNSIRISNQPISNDFVDTLRLARKLLPELKKHRLVDLVKHFNINIDASHRALDDVKATNEVYTGLIQVASEKYQTADDFKAAFKKTRGSRNHFKASDVTADTADFDVDHPLYQHSFVFTGTLEKMHRRDAMQIVVNHGGSCSDSVTKKTDFLVLGNQDYSRIKDGKSSKHKKAEQLKLSGQGIEIISENVFYDLLDN